MNEIIHSESEATRLFMEESKWMKLSDGALSRKFQLAEIRIDKCNSGFQSRVEVYDIEPHEGRVTATLDEAKEDAWRVFKAYILFKMVTAPLPPPAKQT